MQQSLENSEKAILLCGPSGAGKGAISGYLMSHEPRLELSVSATTRLKRDTEIDGIDYHFLSPEVFKKKINDGEFLEWEHVYPVPHGYYGTLISSVEGAWKRGKVVLFDVEVDGALNIKKKLKEKIFTIFIMPPSIEALKERLMKRGSETTETLKSRLDRAPREISLAPQFDAVVVNDNLEKAQKEAFELMERFLRK